MTIYFPSYGFSKYVAILNDAEGSRAGPTGSPAQLSWRRVAQQACFVCIVMDGPNRLPRKELLSCELLTMPAGIL